MEDLCTELSYVEVFTFSGLAVCKKNTEPCLWFLLRSKSYMLWNIIGILLVRKATGNHLIKSTSLEKTQNPVSGFCYARNRVRSAV